MPFEGVKVEGFRGLIGACTAAERDMRLGVRAALREAAEPVRQEAERLAPIEIRNIGPAWSRMRVGVTSRYVYVAPKSRRHGGSPRPNLARLLGIAMEDALEAKRGEVEMAVEVAIDKIADRDW